MRSAAVICRGFGGVAIGHIIHQSNALRNVFHGILRTMAAQGRHNRRSLMGMCVDERAASANDLLMPVISRSEARVRGLRSYFTGKPCVNGHLSHRYTDSMTCAACHTEGRQRRRERDPGAFKAIEAAAKSRYQAKKTARSVERRNGAKLQRLADAGQRITDMSRLKNIDFAKYLSDFGVEHPVVLKLRAVERLAAEIERTPPWFGELDDLAFREAADVARRRTDITGHKWSIDHIVALLGREASGLHCAANIQVIPARMNMSKGNRLCMTSPGEWLRHL
jgi:hypothetical protein